MQIGGSSSGLQLKQDYPSGWRSEACRHCSSGTGQWLDVEADDLALKSHSG
jgi:hypothetical protein